MYRRLIHRLAAWAAITFSTFTSPIAATLADEPPATIEPAPAVLVEPAEPFELQASDEPPSDAQLTDAQSSDVQSSDVQPSENQPSEAQPLPVPPLPARSVTAPQPTPAKRERATIKVHIANVDDVTLEPRELEGREPKDIGPAEVIRQYYADGSLMLEREVVQDARGNYINHGSWKFLDRKGKIAAQGVCRENQYHGAWTRVIPAAESTLFKEAPYNEYLGPFVSEAEFNDGLLHGTWVICDAESRKVSEIEFANGERHGIATWWYVSGQKMLEQHFDHGLATGELKHWTPSGELVTRETYIAGRRLVSRVEYFENKQKKSEEGLLLPQLIVKEGDNWWKARLAKYELQGELESHGTATTWYPNGRMKSQAEFELGNRIGDHAWWYEDGQKAAEGSFKGGIPDGTWTWWHRNGQKAVAGDYEAGNPTGEWSSWKSDGQLANRVNQSNKGDSHSKLELASPKPTKQLR